jgi:calcium binding protein 39
VKDVLTKHKQMVCQYLCANFDLFFSMYNVILLKSESYVTKRQSIKLLGEILLDRANYPVMIRYVDSYDNLVLHIELMEDGRKMIQYEAFHVFKVFVAKPDWSEGVHKHLFRNKKKFVRVLSRFLEDRTEDDQFLDEKNWLIMRIQEAKPWEPPKNHAKEKTVKTNESVPSPSLGA